FLTKENNAKNVVLMKPGFGCVGKFDIAIIPEHDRPRDRRNVVITEGSCNSINDEAMKDGSRRIKDVVKLSEKRKIGVLLGGDTPQQKLTNKMAEDIVEQLVRSLEDNDMELFLTTSRRTPKGVEDILKKRLTSQPRCKLLLIANERDIENAVGGILDLSDIVVVSGESVSMISEAASSGKRVLVFEPEMIGSRTKHDYALDRMESLGYISKTPVSMIHQNINKLSRDNGIVRRLDNAQRMYRKLYRII
ncbi:MAG: ELM1/GtrOC1 family putative glycosyltransferase, partial [Candidatus Omnitrophota bacterium]